MDVDGGQRQWFMQSQRSQQTRVSGDAVDGLWQQWERIVQYGAAGPAEQKRRGDGVNQSDRGAR